jgi:hypothetical protein
MFKMMHLGTWRERETNEEWLLIVLRPDIQGKTPSTLTFTNNFPMIPLLSNPSPNLEQ